MEASSARPVRRASPSADSQAEPRTRSPFRRIARLATAWSPAACADTTQVANGFYTSGCALSGAKSAAVTFSGSASAKFACRMVFPDGAANAGVDGISLYQVESGEGTNTSNVTIKNGALTCTD